MDPADDAVSSAHDRAELLLEVIDALPLPTVGIDEQFRITLWNAAAERAFGWQESEVLGKRNPTIPPELLSEHEDQCRRLFAGGRVTNAPSERIRRDGTRIRVLVSTAAAPTTPGAPPAAISVYTDLTTIETVAARMQSAELRMRALLESTSDFAVLIFDGNGVLKDRNRTARELLRIGRARPRFDELLPGHTSPSPCERWVQRGDGTRVWADVVITDVDSGSDRERIVIARDAEDRRLAARQRAEIFAFAHKALIAADLGQLRADAMHHVREAVRPDAAEFLEHMLGATDLVPFDTFGLASRRVRTAAAAITAEAARTLQPVHRALHESDFAAAPHLREARLRYGLAVPVDLGDTICVLAVYSREHPFAEADVYPVLGCGSFLAGAARRMRMQQQLSEREAALQMVMDQLPAMVWTLDADLRMTGLRGSAFVDPVRAGAAVGKHISEVIAPDQSYVIEAFQRVLRGGSARYTYAYGDRIVDVRATPLRAADGTIRGALAVGFDVRERVRAEEELRVSREQLRRTAARLSQIQEEERKRIARELHDEMGRFLTALRFEVDLLRREVGTPATTERFASVGTLVRELGDAVRRISSDLRPSVLDDFGFRAAVESELAGFERRTGIATSLAFPECDAERLLDSERITALFRIVQEALTNVARHSGATRVSVVLQEAGQQITLTVHDDGRGIDAGEATGAGSHGLVGVRERASALGGTVELEGAPEAGTRLTVRLPLHDANEDERS